MNKHNPDTLGLREAMRKAQLEYTAAQAKLALYQEALVAQLVRELDDANAELQRIKNAQAEPGITGMYD